MEIQMRIESYTQAFERMDPLPTVEVIAATLAYDEVKAFGYIEYGQALVVG